MGYSLKRIVTFVFVSAWGIAPLAAGAAAPTTAPAQARSGFEQILAPWMDSESRTGFIAQPPEATGWSTVTISGKRRGDWIEYRRSSDGVREAILHSKGQSQHWRQEPGQSAPVQLEGSRYPNRPDLQPDRQAPVLEGDGIYYFWSSSLPLSVEGIRVIRNVARELGLPLTLVADPLTPGGDQRFANLPEFRSLGAFHHYPGILVSHAGRLTSPAYRGIRTQEEWTRIIRQEITRPPAFSSAREALAQAEEKLDQLSALRVVPLPSPSLVRKYPISKGLGNSAFYQTVPHQPYVLDYNYNEQWRVHLIHQKSGKEVLLGSTGGDPYPLPDGRVVLMPEQTMVDPRLHFFGLRDLVAEGSQAKPFFTSNEPEGWWYASAGFLKDRTGNRTIVRVLTRRDGLRVNHFELEQGLGRPRMRALGPRQTVCPNVQGAGPVLSRDGKWIAVKTENAGMGSAIYQIPENLRGDCPLVRRLPIDTTKMAWAPGTSSWVSFSSNGSNGVQNYLYEIQSGNLILLPQKFPGCASLTSPRILEDREILLICVPETAGLKSHLYLRY